MKAVALQVAALAVSLASALGFGGIASSVRIAQCVGHAATPARCGGSLLRMSDGDRELQSPPDPSRFQTDSQRRRNRPLSKLKRKKKESKLSEVYSGGELRPLVAKSDRESVLRGEDYWVDYQALDREKERQAAVAAARKLASKEQFKPDKLRDEIVSPYKQNWLLVIIVVIGALVGFVQLNPGILDTFPVIKFPDEL